MSVQTTTSRPAGKSVGAAAVGLVVTLVVFVVVFVAFLIAPLAVLVLAYLAYVVMRPRAGRTTTSGPSSRTGPAAQSFGSGAS